MSQKDLIKRRSWKNKLESWKESGLSGPEWCEKNQENYHQFGYWKKALKLKAPQKHYLFDELKDHATEKEKPSEGVKIELRHKDLIICFPNGSNPQLLELCLTLLCKVEC